MRPDALNLMPATLVSLRYTCEFVEGFERLGIEFVVIEERLVVDRLDPYGEAFTFNSERGGILAGDQLWKINDQKVTSITAAEQLQSLRTLEYPLRLVFRRPNRDGTSTPVSSCCSSFCNDGKSGIGSTRGSLRSIGSFDVMNQSQGLEGAAPDMLTGNAEEGRTVPSTSVVSESNVSLEAEPSSLEGNRKTGAGASSISMIGSNHSRNLSDASSCAPPHTQRNRSCSVLFWLNQESDEEEERRGEEKKKEGKRERKSPEITKQQLASGGSGRLGSPVRVDPKMMTGVPLSCLENAQRSPERVPGQLRRRKLSQDSLEDVPEEPLTSPDRQRRYNELLAMLPGGSGHPEDTDKLSLSCSSGSRSFILLGTKMLEVDSDEERDIDNDDEIVISDSSSEISSTSQLLIPGSIGKRSKKTSSPSESNHKHHGSGFGIEENVYDETRSATPTSTSGGRSPPQSPLGIGKPRPVNYREKPCRVVESYSTPCSPVGMGVDALTPMPPSLGLGLGLPNSSTIQQQSLSLPSSPLTYGGRPALGMGKPKAGAVSVRTLPMRVPLNPLDRL